MQMISKNKNGITMIALIVTIITFSIILGITLNYGLSEIHDVDNKKTESELTIVQEAIMQRYALVKSKNQLGITAPSISNTDETDSTRPAGFVGTRIDTETITSQFSSKVTPLKTYDSNTSDLTFEEYYYLLSEEDLIDLGIEKGDDSKISDDISAKQRSYIVNYSTGEIFDNANKKYYITDITNDDPIYKQPTQITMDENEYEFNDN